MVESSRRVTISTPDTEEEGALRAVRGPLRALVVSDGDAALTRPDLEILARQAGVRLDAVQSVAEGVERARRGGHECVVLATGSDPDTALAALARLRAGAPDVPVMVIVDHAAHAVARATLEHGAHGSVRRDELGPGALERAVGDAAARSRSERQVALWALHDALTGLPNRRLMYQLVGHALDDGELSVLFVDLDGFKQINDTLGHAAGDEALVIVAERIDRVLRPSDRAGRLGGDEFVVLCPGLVDADAARSVAARIVDAISTPLALRDGMASISASIGVARAGAGDTPASLIAAADVAMYRAKRTARGAVALAAEYAERTAESDDRELVRRSITAGQIEVAYQPIVSVATGEVVAVEALARVQHRELGAVAPGRLVPDIGDGLLGALLDRLVLEAACRALADPARAGLSLHVNLSPSSVANPSLAGEMREVAERAGLAMSRLRLELSGGALGEDARPGGAISALRALGAQVVADDLGAGGPTLAVLARTSFDLLKLDRSLVASVDSDDRARAVAAAVIALGSALGLSVIAEGVERAEQLEQLRGLGCHLAQGHLFGVAGPLPLAL
jgi:diguanylate cyclase (GGDEF)-like protein